MDNERHIGEQEDFSRLDALGQTLSAKRKEAVDFRQQSGIEEIWQEDDDFYNGIDDSNRAERYTKPSSSSGRPVSSKSPKSSTKSNVFVNITQPYVDLASSRAADMLLPTDDRPFGLSPTPLADLAEYENSDEPQVFPDGSRAPAKDVVKLIRAKAAEEAQKDEDQIWDWLCECQWHSESRRVLEDAARIGTGVVKGPIPYQRKTKRVVKSDDGTVQVVVASDIKPKSKRICATNLFPDPSCNENIHNGSYIWERDYLSKKQLMDLRGGDYLDEQIDKCIKEGPNGSTDEPGEEKKKLFEVWYYNGLLEKEELESAGCECEKEEVPAIITMVNDRVIKAAMSPIDSGEFPYDVLVWQRKTGSWAGSGVARQVRTPQRIITAATRKMLDNAGLSAGPIKFFRLNGVTPSSGDYSLIPDKTFFVDATETRSVRDMVHFVEIPNHQDKFASIIQYALDLAERLTSMPLLMQGQQGSATETVGGMQILQQNGGTVQRRIAKLFDDLITEPHIARYYEWLMIYEGSRGDAVIDARGSSVLFERDATNQALMQMAAVVKDPDFDIDPKKWIVEVLRAQKIDPESVQYSDEERQKREELKAKQPQIDPRVAGQLEVAKIRADGDMQKAQLTQQSDIDELQLKREIETGKLTAKIEDAEKQRQHDLAMKQMEYEMKVMEFSVSQGIALDELKAKLADTSMKLNVQQALSEKALAAKNQERVASMTRAKTETGVPPSEPSGRAPDTQSYEL